MAAHIGVDKSTYSKIEKGLREVTVIELQKIAALFNTFINKVVNFDGEFPKEIILEDKNTDEQIRLIQQLEDEDKHSIFKLIDKMLTNKKLKTSFKKMLLLWKA